MSSAGKGGCSSSVAAAAAGDDNGNVAPGERPENRSTTSLPVTIRNLANHADGDLDVVAIIENPNADGAFITAKELKRAIAAGMNAADKKKKKQCCASTRPPVQWEHIRLAQRVEDNSADPQTDATSGGEEIVVCNEDEENSPSCRCPSSSRGLSLEPVTDDEKTLERSREFLEHNILYCYIDFKPFEDRGALNHAVNLLYEARVEIWVLQPMSIVDRRRYNVERIPLPGIPQINDASGEIMEECQTLEDVEQIYGPVRVWDVSRVESLAYLFSLYTGFGNGNTFNEDISGWNVAGVKDFYGMFSECIEFNQPIGEWNMDSAEITCSMFDKCFKFNQDLNSWNLRNVDDFSYMFRWCEKFEMSNLVAWDTTAVQDTSGMFAAGRSSTKNGFVAEVRKIWGSRARPRERQEPDGSTRFYTPWELPQLRVATAMFDTPWATVPNLSSCYPAEVATLRAVFGDHHLNAVISSNERELSECSAIDFENYLANANGHRLSRNLFVLPDYAEVFKVPTNARGATGEFESWQHPRRARGPWGLPPYHQKIALTKFWKKYLPKTVLDNGLVPLQILPEHDLLQVSESLSSSPSAKRHKREDVELAPATKFIDLHEREARIRALLRAWGNRKKQEEELARQKLNGQFSKRMSLREFFLNQLHVSEDWFDFVTERLFLVASELSEVLDLEKVMKLLAADDFPAVCLQIFPAFCRIVKLHGEAPPDYHEVRHHAVILEDAVCSIITAARLFPEIQRLLPGSLDHNKHSAWLEQEEVVVKWLQSSSGRRLPAFPMPEYVRDTEDENPPGHKYEIVREDFFRLRNDRAAPGDPPYRRTISAFVAE
ncbi:unnamed protein product [Amoebophrya sp. A120]|nr:unnamed protein product [Amoebophrya sp. A120]|eukprot:GSA120T00026123001.1